MKTPMENYEALMAKVSTFEDYQSPEAMSAVANALFYTVRMREELDSEEWLARVAFLSGLASGILIGVAHERRLREENTAQEEAPHPSS